MAEICWMNKIKYTNQKKREEEQAAACSSESRAEPEEVIDEPEDEQQEEEGEEDDEEEGAVGGEEEEEEELDLGFLDDIEYQSDYDDDIADFIDESEDDQDAMVKDSGDHAPATRKRRL